MKEENIVEVLAWIVVTVGVVCVLAIAIGLMLERQEKYNKRTNNGVK